MGTQKEIWDTFVLFAYLLALFSQSYVLTMIHHHYNSIYPIYISLLYIWQYQPSVLHKAHWLITNRRTQSLKLLNTHTTTPTTAHFGPKDQIPLSSPPKIAVSFEGKIYNVTLSRWRLTALKRLWRSVFQIDDFSNWKRNIDIRFAVTIGITQCKKKSVINSMYFYCSNLF